MKKPDQSPPLPSLTTSRQQPSYFPHFPQYLLIMLFTTLYLKELKVFSILKDEET